MRAVACNTTMQACPVDCLRVPCRMWGRGTRDAVASRSGCDCDDVISSVMTSSSEDATSLDSHAARPFGERKPCAPTWTAPTSVPTMHTRAYTRPHTPTHTYAQLVVDLGGWDDHARRAAISTGCPSNPVHLLPCRHCPNAPAAHTHCHHRRCHCRRPVPASHTPPTLFCAAGLSRQPRRLSSRPPKRDVVPKPTVVALLAGDGHVYLPSPHTIDG
jgi:hypothetical protein